MKRAALAAFVLLIVALGVGGWAFARAISAPGGTPQYFRVEGRTPLESILPELEARGIIRSARATGFLARLMRRETVKTGTYRLSGGLEARANLRAFVRPIVQMVRLPDTNWARRSAHLLERAQVCTAEAYDALVARPADAKAPFPLPETSLEGYLYPDTYDLPPLLGARGVVDRQLDAFRQKVWEGLDHPKDLYRTLIVASLVQLESGRDEDRPLIAGVIENRLKKRMRLQIDASINYGLGKWRPLRLRDYKEVDSPYNLYRHDGLPPTPICSPNVASIRAAMAPASHNYLYYVAMPDGRSLFAATFEEHKKNIARRKEALKRRNPGA